MWKKKGNGFWACFLAGFMLQLYPWIPYNEFAWSRALCCIFTFSVERISHFLFYITIQFGSSMNMRSRTFSYKFLRGYNILYDSISLWFMCSNVRFFMQPLCKSWCHHGFKILTRSSLMLLPSQNMKLLIILWLVSLSCARTGCF